MHFSHSRMILLRSVKFLRDTLVRENIQDRWTDRWTGLRRKILALCTRGAYVTHFYYECGRYQRLSRVITSRMLSRRMYIAQIYYVFSGVRNISSFFARIYLLYIMCTRYTATHLYFSTYAQGLPRGWHVLRTGRQRGFLSRERGWIQRGIQATPAAQSADEGPAAALPPGTGRPAGQFTAIAHQYLRTGEYRALSLSHTHTHTHTNTRIIILPRYIVSVCQKIA